jgi:integrase/recombinase XerD
MKETPALTVTSSTISSAAAAEPTLIEFTTFLRLDSAGGDPSPDTLRGYLSGAQAFLAWAASRCLSAGAATEDDVRAYRRELVERGYARSTVAHRLAVVRRLFDAIAWRGLRLDNPAAGIRPPRPLARIEDRVRSLSIIELDRLFRAVPATTLDELRDRTALALMALHGLRSIEVHRAAVSDLQLPEGGTPVLRVHGKTGERTLYLRDDVAELVGAYLVARRDAGIESSALVIVHGNRARGRRLSRRSLDSIANRHFAGAGLPHRGCHILRHTAATLSLAAGAGIEHVQTMLGHASLTTTSVYAHAIARAENNPAALIGVAV